MPTESLSNSHEVLDQLLGPSSLRIALHGIWDIAGPVPRTIGHEALMRGPRGAPYETPPLAFAMAATLGSLERLDCYCVALASRVEADGLLFVNVHPRTITGSEDFWASLALFGNEIEREPSQVVIEVVEHSAARESDLRNALLELRALGFGIAVDDLGEGTSGLRRLVEVAPDYAKIDRFFISGIDVDRRRRAVVEAIVRMAGEIPTRVICEGVEREEELAVLRDLGVTLAQGFHFGRPMEVPS